MQLVITFEDGKVSVSGPIDDRIFCYGVLGMARDLIAEHNEKKSDLEAAPAIMLAGNISNAIGSKG